MTFRDWNIEKVNAHNARVAKKEGSHFVGVDWAGANGGGVGVIVASDPQAKTLEIKATFEIKPSTDEEKLNKTERRFLNERLRPLKKAVWIGIQAITLKLGDDCRYTPDFAAAFADRFIFYETKGFMRDDAQVKLKVAARNFPWATFVLVRWENHQWTETEIKP